MVIRAVGFLCVQHGRWCESSQRGEGVPEQSTASQSSDERLAKPDDILSVARRRTSLSLDKLRFEIKRWPASCREPPRNLLEPSQVRVCDIKTPRPNHTDELRGYVVDLGVVDADFGEEGLESQLNRLLGSPDGEIPSLSAQESRKFAQDFRRLSNEAVRPIAIGQRRPPAGGCGVTVR